MYGRLNENGHLEVFSKKYLEKDGRIIVNPSDNILREAGYKPIVDADLPEAPRGATLTVDYVDAGDNIQVCYGLVGEE